MDWGIIIGLMGLVVGIAALFKGEIIKGFRWKRSRKIELLNKERKHFVLLNEDFKYFVGWFSESILSVLALLAAALMFNGVAIEQGGEYLANGFISLMSVAAYVFATYRLGQYRRLKQFTGTIEALDKQINRLRNKG